MWQRATTNWNIFRIIRLLLGLMIVIQSIQFKEYWFVLVGAAFAGLAVFDMGCAGGNCAAPPLSKSATSQQLNETTYEEVDNK